jgi:hypothetical protein
MQPIIDTIRLAGNPVGPNQNRTYEVYHYTVSGAVDQEVIVVADIADTSFQGTPTQDGHPVGVITGYCLTGGGSAEPECPD